MKGQIGSQSLVARIRANLFSWRSLKWTGILLAIAIALITIGNIYMNLEERKNIELIQNIKVTMADADGSKLPPEPDAVQNNETIAGIDSNNNNIRDDVERAIFEKYPGDKNLKLRAALMQYAQSLQKSLTLVIWKETWSESAKVESRASLCVGEVSRNGDHQESYERFLSLNAEIESLVLNNENRKSQKNSNEGFAGSWGGSEKPYCDL